MPTQHLNRLVARLASSSRSQPGGRRAYGYGTPRRKSDHFHCFTRVEWQAGRSEARIKLKEIWNWPAARQQAVALADLCVSSSAHGIQVAPWSVAHGILATEHWGFEVVSMTALALKERHREVRNEQPEALRLRIHRALSWLIRSEQEASDPDARFILQWIALNAAYAREFGRAETERERASDFIAVLVKLDGKRRLHQALFQQFSGPIRNLIDNKFTFEPFWTAMRTHDSSGRWEESFAKGKKAAFAAVMQGDTAKVLGIVFDRLYVLRNQLVHGGATWNSQINRAQIIDGAAILGALVPLVLETMMDYPEQDYGDVLYPVVG